MKMKSTTLQKTFWIVCVMTLFKLSVSAQNTSTVTGTVMNENGELLMGVTVKATNLNSKESYTTVTNAKGLFSFPN